MKRKKKQQEDMNLLWCTLEKYWIQIPQSKLSVSVAKPRVKFQAKEVTIEVKAKDEFSGIPKPVN